MTSLVAPPILFALIIPFTEILCANEGIIGLNLRAHEVALRYKNRDFGMESYRGDLQTFS